MKKRGRIFFGLIVILLLNLFVFTITPVLADGIMIEPDPEETVWDQITGQYIESSRVSVGRVVGETNQEAFISWDNKTKTEKMMIIVDKEQRVAQTGRWYRVSNDAVYWIVPIKSECRDITPYHYDRFSSKMEVIDINDEAKNRLKKTRDVILGMQIWPLLSKLTEKRSSLQLASKSAGLGAEDMLWGGYERDVPEVQVYKEIESFGVRTEILSAQSVNALEDYLRNNGIKLSESLNDVIDSYVNTDYCFAVSKVTKPDEKGKLGIMLEFKPDKPFYPLYITSAYGKKNIGVSITTDFVGKAMMGRSELETKELYLEGEFTYGKDEDILFGKRDILTKVELNEPASNFTSDIYFEKSLSVKFLARLKLCLWLVMILAVLIISFILGVLLFRAHWIKAGILNSLFGIVGMIIGFLVSFHYEKGNLRERIQGLKNVSDHSEDKNYLGIVFMWNRIILALPILLLLLIPILIFGGYEIQNYIGDIFKELLQQEEFAAIFFLIAAPITFITSLISFLVKRIIKAHKVDINTRELLINIAMFIVNLFEAVVLFSLLIVFIAMGPKGWVIGVVTIAIILGFIIMSKKDPGIARTILVVTPFVYIILAFLNIIAAIIALLAVYPYLINYYYSKNILEVAEYLKKKEDEEKSDERHEHRRMAKEQYLPRLILFSVIFVLLYMGLDKIINNLL